MELTIENYIELKKDKTLKRIDIAKRMGVSEHVLKRWITKHNLGTVRPTVRNPSAFAEHNKESAYWAGFLAADGCVDEKGRVRFYLQKSDTNHLEKFANFVKSDHKINVNNERNRCSLEFTCREMVQDLAFWNIVPRKSLEYCPPKEVPFLRDFLRGYFDGDGTICESFSNRNSLTATLYAGIACSRNFRDWFMDLLPSISKTITLKQHERKNHITITMNTNKSKEFLTYLYEGSTECIRLDRKYDLYVKTVVNDNRKTREL